MRLATWLKRLPPPGLLAVIYLAFIAVGAGGSRRSEGAAVNHK